ncbi:MAG: hypothetical protein ACYC06_08250 [Ilumatobacteraceae bacterium]
MAFKFGEEQKTVEVDELYQCETALFEDDECDLERYIDECTTRNPDFPRLMEQARSRLTRERLRLPRRDV